MNKEIKPILQPISINKSNTNRPILKDTFYSGIFVLVHDKRKQKQPPDTYLRWNSKVKMYTFFNITRQTD